MPLLRTLNSVPIEAFIFEEACLSNNQLPFFGMLNKLQECFRLLLDIAYIFILIPTFQITRELGLMIFASVFIYMYVYVYIYIYIWKVYIYIYVYEKRHHQDTLKHMWHMRLFNSVWYLSIASFQLSLIFIYFDVHTFECEHPFELTT